MARAKKHEEHENHERWLVSYADFITLLFAFFVVMYSVSSVNEGKYRVLSDSLSATFKEPKRSLDPIQVGKLVRSPYTDEVSLQQSPMIMDIGLPGDLPKKASQDGEGRGDGEGQDGSGEADADSEAAQGRGAAMASLEQVADSVHEKMSDLIERDLVAIRQADEWLEVEFRTSILFASGDARLAPEAIDVLSEIAGILTGFPNPVQVEGFTDNVPIRTTRYPSNWELSAARAASVVSLFTKYGVKPERMVAIGYGEHRPVADNATLDGRGKNRRVVLVIPADENTRRSLDLQRLSDFGGAGGSVRPALPAGDDPGA